MRVGAFAATGEPSVMRVVDRPAPRAPRGTELLVAVAASSVNGTDLGLRRGDLGPLTWGRLPLVPGFDVAGEVLACGEGVSAFRPGDRVAALLGHRGGGLAERVLVAQDRAARVPDALALTTAAAVPLAGLTALQGLHRVGRLPRRPRPAEEPLRVLVAGAAGGIGSFAVALAALAGAHVVATTSAGKREWVRGLGAHDVLDRHRERPADLARVALAFDTSGRARHRDLAPALDPRGTMVSVRPLHPDTLRGLAPGGPRVAAVRTAARSADLAHLLDLAARGALHVPLRHVVGLDEVARAHALAESEARGKVVVDLRA